MLQFDDNYYLEEERQGFVISSMMKRAWAAQLEVLEEIRRVCSEMNIRFFADFGTLLGAVRHNGFIPWDDDIDICMLREDYMQFLEKAPDILEEWYEVKSVYNDPTFDIVKARVINGRHMNFESVYLQKFHCCPYVVGVDIFPVDRVPDDIKKYNELMESLNFLLKVEASIPMEGPYEDDVLTLVRNIEKNYGVPINYSNRLQHEIKKVYDSLCALYQGETTRDVGCMMALGAGWKGYRYNREIYESVIEMPFENTTIPVPIGYDLILKSCYGEDYMIPRNVGASHEYPFYREQIQGLKEIMEKEFQTQLSDEQMEELINMKVFRQ